MISDYSWITEDDDDDVHDDGDPRDMTVRAPRYDREHMTVKDPAAWSQLIREGYGPEGRSCGGRLCGPKGVVGVGGCPRCTRLADVKTAARFAALVEKLHYHNPTVPLEQLFLGVPRSGAEKILRDHWVYGERLQAWVDAQKAENAAKELQRAQTAVERDRHAWAKMAELYEQVKETIRYQPDPRSGGAERPRLLGKPGVRVFPVWEIGSGMRPEIHPGDYVKSYAATYLACARVCLVRGDDVCLHRLPGYAWYTVHSVKADAIHKCWPAPRVTSNDGIEATPDRLYHKRVGDVDYYYASVGGISWRWGTNMAAWQETAPVTAELMATCDTPRLWPPPEATL